MRCIARYRRLLRSDFHRGCVKTQTAEILAQDYTDNSTNGDTISRTRALNPPLAAKYCAANQSQRFSHSLHPKPSVGTSAIRLEPGCGQLLHMSGPSLYPVPKRYGEHYKNEAL
jgi:hypothetical protein